MYYSTFRATKDFLSRRARARPAIVISFGASSGTGWLMWKYLVIGSTSNPMDLSETEVRHVIDTAKYTNIIATPHEKITWITAHKTYEYWYLTRFPSLAQQEKLNPDLC
jgi:hypothetical protein